jgi:hypothetical protein
MVLAQRAEAYRVGTSSTMKEGRNIVLVGRFL